MAGAYAYVIFKVRWLPSRSHPGSPSFNAAEMYGQRDPWCYGIKSLALTKCQDEVAHATRVKF